MSVIMEASAQRAALANLTAAGAGPAGIASNLKLRLFSNPHTPTPLSALSDFVECAFAGYAESIVLVWGVPLDDDRGNAISYPPSIQFTHAGGGTAETAYGWYITDDPPTKWILCEKFETAEPMGAVGDGVLVQARLFMPPQPTGV